MLSNPKVKFVKISRHHFDIITPKDNNTIYFIEENSGEITLNLGDEQITSGRFSNDELLGLFEGKQDIRPNGTDLLIIDGEINPLYIEYIENDIDSIKLKDIEQDNRLDIIESDIEDIETNVQTNTNDVNDLDVRVESAESNITNLEEEVEDIKEDYVTEVALDLQLLEKLNIRPNGTDLLVIDGKINNVYVDSLYVTDIETVNTEAEMLALPDMKRGDMAIVVNSETTYVLKQTPSNDINNWAKLLSKPEVISVNGKTGIVHIGISDIDGLQGILNSKLDITTYTDDMNELGTRVGTLEISKQDKLVAGDNITIDENNVISTSDSGGSDFHRVRIFNEQDELITTQMIQEDGKVEKIDKPGYLFDYGTRNEFDYNTTITEDLDLTYSIKPPRYVQTTSADFNSSGDYIGTEEYIILPKDKPSGYKIVNPNVIGVATNGDYLTDASDMFNGNTSLYLELDYFDTSNATNMSYMFYNSQATELDLSNFDTSNVTNMNRMFYGSQVTTLDLSNFNTSNVTDMGSMFSNSQATIFDVSNFDTSKVTNMSDMFLNSQATELDVSNFDTSNATNMSYMFHGSQATELDLSNFDTSNVTNMNRMFRVSQATSLDLSSFDTSNVTNMAWMFAQSQATTLDLSSFDTSNVTDMDWMFYNSQATTGYARTQTDADNFNNSSNKPSTLTFVVKEDSPAGKLFNRVRIFNEQDGLVATQIIYDGEKVMRPSTGGILYYYNTLDKFDYNDDVTEDIDLTQIIIIPPRYVQTTVEDFDSNGDYTGTEEYIILPADKTSGYEIVNPNVKGVATDGDYLTDASSMFEGHSGLYLELDYLNTSNVTNMNSMFLYSQATELDLSNFNTSNVTTMNRMFRYSKATTLDLSSFDTSNVTTMNRMFESSQATELDLSSFDTSNVNSVYMSSMFTSSQATTGYARTQADADKFNNSSFKPSTLTFVVK